MIAYFDSKRMFAISTKNTTMIMCVKDKKLVSVYWGGSVRPEDIVPPEASAHSSFDPSTLLEREEFPIHNGRMYTEPCLVAGTGNQNALFFSFDRHRIEENKLLIFLKEESHGLELTLEYHVFEEFDIIGRKATLKNTGKELHIERFFSGCCTLPNFCGSELRYLAGKWVGECQICDTKLEPGLVTLQSKRGVSGPHFNPSFAVHDNASEENGNVWFGMLAYSGNWKINIEKTIMGNTHVLAGRNNYDARETLQKEETLDTPMFYTGFSANGFGEMSRKLHAFQHTNFLMHKEPAAVLYNSWEATTFAVNVKSQMLLAEKAAAMGVELFVVDDGWFGERHSDKAGLGDWTVNSTKFPKGLAQLIDYVKSLGMNFGIWVEPEAVNPDSELFRLHPEWIYSIPGIEPMTSRFQYVLDFSLPEVIEYVKKSLNELLANNDIRFLKWDMNRPISDVYTEGNAGNGLRRRQHVNGLYEIWGWLKKNFPHVALESCSGGGGRVDLGILQWANQFWPSDNTDPFERLFIQEGFSQFYAPATMVCWVTDTPEKAGRIGRTNVAYKFYSAMCGPLGIGADIACLDNNQVQEYKNYIEFYKTIRKTVQFGELHRLSSPQTGLSAVQYIFEKQVVVFAFLHSQKFGDKLPRLKLKGLKPNCIYQTNKAGSLSGGTLMNFGIDTGLVGDFSAECFVLNIEN